MRCAVVLGKGKYPDELAGFCAEDGPRLEFVEIAKALGGALVSFTSEKKSYGAWFSRIFSKRPIYGSAVAVALRASDFDRIYVTGEDIGFALACLLKLRRWKGEIVCVVHNMTPRKSRILNFIGHTRFSAFVTVSLDQANILRDRHSIPDHKLINVWNWVDESFFKPVPVKPDRARPVIVACGAENRDYRTLAAAARSCDVDFVVFGHGFFGENTLRLSQDELPENLVFMPRVPAAELARAYAQADLIVLPVNNVAYAAGVTGLVEAMASGRPVVVSRTTGLATYLANIDDDLIVKPHEPTLLAAALSRALADQARLEQIGLRNRDWIVANASLDHYVERIKRIMLP